MKQSGIKMIALLGLTTALTGFAAQNAGAVTFHVGDGSIDGSLCIGLDCTSSESFGFDTLRLKENNLRVHFDDTSTSASFPDNDWRIIINDSANGGAEYFGIQDSSHGRIPFRVEATARENALYVESDGDIGIGTNNPVVDLHIVTGNTPTLRLDQDGSSGFSPQVFDVAANETNFFIRDATNGSTLPFRIRPGAPTSAIDISVDGDVGIGTASPDSSLHVKRSTGALTNMLNLENNSDSAIVFTNTDAGAATPEWKLASFQGNLFIGTPTTAGAEFLLSNTGNLTITGNFISGATTLNVPDYVFEDDYKLMPLSEVERFIAENGHLPRIPSAAVIGADGLNMSQMQMALLEKVEELTLYTLDQEKKIESLTVALTQFD